MAELGDGCSLNSSSPPAAVYSRAGCALRQPRDVRRPGAVSAQVPSGRGGVETGRSCLGNSGLSRRTEVLASRELSWVLLFCSPRGGGREDGENLRVKGMRLGPSCRCLGLMLQ